MAHPPNAAFISGDGLVSFDEFGRKLDSQGNVVWGDSQSLRGANAKPNPEYWERKFQQELAALQQQLTASERSPGVQAAPSAWQTPTPPQAGGGSVSPANTPAITASQAVKTNAIPRPLTNHTSTADVLRGPYQPQTPTPQVNQSGGETFRYDPLSSAVAGSLPTVRDYRDYMVGLNLPIPDNRRFDPYPATTAPTADVLRGPYEPTKRIGALSPAMQYVQSLNQQGMLPGTSWAPYGVTEPLPGVSREQEEEIRRAVAWR